MKDIIRCKQGLRDIYKSISNIIKDTEYQEKETEFLKKYDLISDNDKVKFVVCGDWSTGKSTLISALTGRRDIAIGKDITTDSVTEYSYEDYYIVDTPGFSIIEEHNEKAMEALLNSDAVLYCIIAHQGFSDINDFKKLVDYLSNKTPIMVILTQFGSDGNDNPGPCQQQIIDQLEENGIFGIDAYATNAKEYIDGLDKNDQDRMDASYIDELKYLISTLYNEDDQDLCVIKCERQINHLESVIDKCIEDIKANFSESDEELYNKQIKDEYEKIDNLRKNIRHRINNGINNLYDLLNDADKANSLSYSIKNRMDQLLSEIETELNEELYFVYPSMQSNQDKSAEKICFELNAETGQIINNLGNSVINTADTVNDLAKPTMLQRIMGKKPGAKGTALAKPFEKIAGKKGIKLSKKIGGVASKISKYASLIQAAGVALGTILALAGPVLDEWKSKKEYQELLKARKEINFEIQNFKENINSSVDRIFKKRFENIEYKVNPKSNLNLRLISKLKAEKMHLKNIKDDICRNEEDEL